MPEIECERCGACCRWPGHVLLTADDIARLAAHLGLAETDFIERYCELARNRAQLTLRDGPDGTCVFLDGNDCRVYDARPRQCREFPTVWSVEGCPACRSAR